MAILAYDDVMLREPGLLMPGRKPVGLVRAASPKLVVCIPLVKTGASVWDYAQKSMRPLSGSYTLSPQSILFDGSSAFLNVCSASLLVGKNITILARTRNTSTTNNSLLGCANTGTSTVSRINVHLPFSGTVYWDFGIINNGGRLSVAYTVSTTQYTTWAFVASGGNYMAIWANGAKLAEQSSGDSAGFAGSTQPFTLGRFTIDSPLYYYPGDVECFYVWTRRLPDAEIVSMTRDPYQIFIPD
jgi:hypothetical protein